MSSQLLIDVGPLTDAQTDGALEHIFKAIGDNDDTLWDKHPSPFVRRMVELFTQRGLMRLSSFRLKLQEWLDGKYHNPSTPRITRNAGGIESPNMVRWSADELNLAKLYLESMPPVQFTIDDHMLLVEYLAQRYLPADDLRTEAEWLATKAVLMGRVQANMAKVTDEQVDTILAALPSTAHEAEARFRLPVALQAALKYATVNAGMQIQRIGDNTRYRVRTVLLGHAERRAQGDPSATSSALESQLLDTFGTLNRDWRRIAVTEAGESANQGFIATQRPGDKVKRVEQYRGACPFCRRLDGEVFEVVPATSPIKDGQTQIWPGKTNVGRSAAPTKRLGGALIPRDAHELWWPAAGVQHPHCRGSWVNVVSDAPGHDKEFGDWLRKTLSGAD